MRGPEPVPPVQAASTACPALDPGAMIGREVWTAGRIARGRSPATLACMRMEAVLPEWAQWRPNPDLDPWTVGLEEEIMLLERDGSPAWRSEDVLSALPEELATHTRGETHGLALELAT